jgi:hypothetical protein
MAYVSQIKEGISCKMFRYREMKQSKSRYCERLDQDHLYPILERPKTNMSRPGIEPVSPASQTSTL